MHTDEHGWELNQLSERVIGCAYTVGNTLGCGFVEKVYENALAHELQKAGLRVDQQQPITVRYDGVIVGEFSADLVVEGLILIELKAVRAFDEVHKAQCLNYLKATGLRICLLINFGNPKVEVKRFAGAPPPFKSVFICVHLWFQFAGYSPSKAEREVRTTASCWRVAARSRRRAA
jgi:GxxExxY protein